MNKIKSKSLSIKWKLYFNSISILIVSLISIFLFSIMQNKRLLSTSIGKVIELNPQNTYVLKSQLDSIVSNSMSQYFRLMSIMIVSVFILGSVAIYKISQYYAHTIKNLGSIAKKIASGRVGVILEYSRNDEVSEVLNAFSSMVSTKKNLSDKIFKTTENIMHGSINSRINEESILPYFSDLAENINKIIDYFTEMLDNVESNIIILDNDFNIKYVNKHSIRLSGKHLDSLLEKNFYNIFKMEDSAEPYSPLKVVFYTGETSSSKTQLHINNTDLDVTYTAIPIKNVKNEVVSVLCFITENNSYKKVSSSSGKRLDYEKEKIEKLIANLGQNYDYEMDQASIWSDIEERINNLETAVV